MCIPPDRAAKHRNDIYLLIMKGNSVKNNLEYIIYVSNRLLLYKPYNQKWKGKSYKEKQSSDFHRLGKLDCYIEWCENFPMWSWGDPCIIETWGREMKALNTSTCNFTCWGWIGCEDIRQQSGAKQQILLVFMNDNCRYAHRHK